MKQHDKNEIRTNNKHFLTQGLFISKTTLIVIIIKITNKDVVHLNGYEKNEIIAKDISEPTSGVLYKVLDKYNFTHT